MIKERLSYLLNMEKKAKRDHLFISYAWEDAALAEWLARKLMNAGYAVWIDRFKILGGDVWPDDIDDAIKHRSFHMIHLLSSHSLRKDNPSKERQLALQMNKNLNKKFLIPLNVDNTSTKELPWQLVDIQYIPFSNWAKGLSKLITALEKSGCPRTFNEKGAELALKSYYPLKALKSSPEVLCSNCYKVLYIPEVIYRYECNVPFTRQHMKNSSFLKWPCYHVSDSRVLCFEQPPDDICKIHGFQESGGSCWALHDHIDSVKSSYIVKNLIYKTLGCIAVKRGLLINSGKYYFSREEGGGKKWLKFKCYTGKTNRIQAYGERKFQRERVRYALAFSTRIRDDILDGYLFMIKLHLHLTDTVGKQIDSRRIPSRRKAIVGNWWNHEWLLRQEAVISFLSDGAESFSLNGEAETQVIFSAKQISGEVQSSLDDDYINSLMISGKSEDEIKQDQIDETISKALKEEANLSIE